MSRRYVPRSTSTTLLGWFTRHDWLVGSDLPTAASTTNTSTTQPYCSYCKRIYWAKSIKRKTCLLLEDIRQLRLTVSTVIHGGFFYIPSAAEFLPSTVPSTNRNWKFLEIQFCWEPPSKGWAVDSCLKQITVSAGQPSVTISPLGWWCEKKKVPIGSCVWKWYDLCYSPII